MFRLIRIWLLAFVCAAFAGAAWAQTIIAEDNAGNYDELDPWVDLSNGGTGFGPWNFDVDEGTGFAGAFVGDPAFAGVSGFGPEAFGLYANPAESGASVLISRDFDVALETNQVFSLQWAVNWDTDTLNRKGFRIYDGGPAGTQLLEVSMNGFPGLVEIDHGAGFVDTEIEFGTGPMTWRVRMIDATTLQVTSTGRDGTPPVVYSTNITVSAAPDSFALFTGAMTPADERQPYYNNLVIYEGPDPDALMITGPDSILLGQTNTLTVHRSAGVGDAITIDNSNPAAISAPATVEFDPEAPTVTFEIVGLDEGSADLQALGNIATSEVFTVTAFDMPEPPEGIYDDATFYPLGWTDGSNGGNGFTAWSLGDEGGAHLIGDATFNGANNAADLNTNGVSFALLGGPDGAYQTASRNFETALIPGDVFTFSMSFQWDGNNRGFDLFSSDGQVFNLNISTSGYDWTGDNNIPITLWPPRDEGVLIDVVITATASGFEYSLSSDQDANIADITGSIVSAALTGFNFYNNEAGEGARFHFNRLEVTESTDPNLFISGPTSVVEGTTNTYTVTRIGDVADFVELQSTNTAAMTVPANVTFDSEENTVTFDAVAVAAGQTALIASNFDAESAPFAVTVTEPPPPSPYSDDASNYDDVTFPWIDGSNGGTHFDPWILVEGDGGFFLGSSTEGGVRTTDIDTAGRAFGMWNGDAANATAAIRPIEDGVWGDGAVLTFEYSFRNDDGARGVTLHDAGLDEFAYLSISGAGYDFNGETNAPTQWDDEREFGEVLTFTFTQNGADLDWAVTGIHPSSPNASGTIIGEMLGAIRFFSAAGGGGGGNDIFFNKLDVTPGVPEPVGPGIDSIVFDAGTGNISFQVPDGYSLSLVQGASLEIVGDGFNWEDLVEDVDYEIVGGEVTILTEVVDGRLIRIWLIED